MTNLDPDPQSSCGLTNLPIEILNLILDNLDFYSLRSLRSTCQLIAPRIKKAQFKARFEGTKFFVLPESFQLLTHLSESPMAKCVNRLVISTTRSENTLYMIPDYQRVLISAFQRFPSLKSIEIQDTVFHHGENGKWSKTLQEIEGTESSYQALKLQRHWNDPRAPRHILWGDEEPDIPFGGDYLHAEKVNHWGYDRSHFTYFDRSTQLDCLFCAVLEACTVAKDKAGVQVTDIRISLTSAWGIDPRAVTEWYSSETGISSSKLAKQKFLASLKVLHVTFDQLVSDRIEEVVQLLSTCSNLKWLRLYFNAEGFCSCFNGEEIIWGLMSNDLGHLERLDLGNVEMLRDSLISFLDMVKPKILNLWSVQLTQTETQYTGEDNLWAEVLPLLPSSVTRVRLAGVKQGPNYGKRRNAHFHGEMVLELPGEYGVEWRRAINEITENITYHPD